jgi:hypothetical protein
VWSSPQSAVWYICKERNQPRLRGPLSRNIQKWPGGRSVDLGDLSLCSSLCVGVFPIRDRGIIRATMGSDTCLSETRRRFSLVVTSGMLPLSPIGPSNCARFAHVMPGTVPWRRPWYSNALLLRLQAALLGFALLQGISALIQAYTSHPFPPCAAYTHILSLSLAARVHAAARL